MTKRCLLAPAILAFLLSCAPPPPPPAAPPSLAAGLAAADPARLIDLSYPFDAGTIYWPTAAPFRLTPDARGITPDGYWYASNSLCASEHGGTHLDAPYHFAEKGWTTERIPLRALVAPAAVVDLRAACAADPDHAATVDEIKAFESAHGAIPDGAVVILWTGWGERWPDRKRYLGDDRPGDAGHLHFPGFSAEAARYLTQVRRVAGVGIDTASIDPGPSRDFQAHRAFAAANAYNLENLDNVERLPPTGATLVALPMKIAGGTGGPVRVLAVLP
jgi:kynurenine formamidase